MRNRIFTAVGVVAIAVAILAAAVPAVTTTDGLAVVLGSFAVFVWMAVLMSQPGAADQPYIVFAIMAAVLMVTAIVPATTPPAIQPDECSTAERHLEQMSDKVAREGDSHSDRWRDYASQRVRDLESTVEACSPDGVLP